MLKVYGVLLTFVTAGLGFALASIPYVGFPGPMLIAIIVAVMYRQWFAYPEKYRSGIDFSAKKILRLAIILYGFKLNVAVILEDGLGMLVQGAAVIVLAIGLTLLIARWLKADLSLALMLGVGAGICGAAAIAAVSPIARAKEDDTAISVGIIALVGTVFALVYIVCDSLLGLPAASYGTWSGISLHEIAHVAAASAPAGEEALAVGLLAKLGRVFLLIPVCFLLAMWMNRKNSAAADEETSGTKVKAHFPWFLLGFIATSLLGTYLPGIDAAIDVLSIVATFLLTAAMVGLGLNINLRMIGTRVWKPAISMIIASIIISIVAYFVVV